MKPYYPLTHKISHNNYTFWITALPWMHEESWEVFYQCYLSMSDPELTENDPNRYGIQLKYYDPATDPYVLGNDIGHMESTFITEQEAIEFGKQKVDNIIKRCLLNSTAVTIDKFK